MRYFWRNRKGQREKVIHSFILGEEEEEEERAKEAKEKGQRRREGLAPAASFH